MRQKEYYYDFNNILNSFDIIFLNNNLPKIYFH